MKRVTFDGHELYERNYNTGNDLKGKAHTLEILDVRIETMHPKGVAEQKPAIYFKGAKRPFAMGKEWAESIARALNEWDAKNWKGKIITIYPVPSSNGADTILARKPEPKTQATK